MSGGIDFDNLPAPREGFLVTHFLAVRDVARSRAFYSGILGGQVVVDENPCIVKLSNSWLIMNPGGGPTPDKPDISVVNYQPGNARRRHPRVLQARGAQGAPSS
jgi:catechol 2,3-dioxygenase-like lactoylglutathione lyase family enzyme